MKCKNCGSIINDGENFCTVCGTKVDGAKPVEPLQPVVANPQQPVAQPQPVQQVVQSVAGKPLVEAKPSFQQLEPVPEPVVQPPQVSETPPLVDLKEEKNKTSNTLIYKVVIGILLVLSVILTVRVVILEQEKKDILINTQEDANKFNVILSGYEFKVSKDYRTNIDKNKLIISDAKGNWTINLQIRNSSYDNLVNNKPALKEAALEKGYKPEEVITKKYNGKEMLILNFEYNGKKYNGCYSKINTNTLVTIEAINKENTYDEELFNIAANIIKSAVYVGENE